MAAVLALVVAWYTLILIALVGAFAVFFLLVIISWLGL